MRQDEHSLRSGFSPDLDLDKHRAWISTCLCMWVYMEHELVLGGGWRLVRWQPGRWHLYQSTSGHTPGPRPVAGNSREAAGRRRCSGPAD